MSPMIVSGRSTISSGESSVASPNPILARAGEHAAGVRDVRLDQDVDVSRRASRSPELHCRGADEDVLRARR